LQEELGSFSACAWRFVNGRPVRRKRGARVPARTEISDALSRDLKRRGFRFVGSTIVYAFMQATGMVNDHSWGCFCSAKPRR
jgi:DNA-3-methyladenine glycosylase I